VLTGTHGAHVTVGVIWLLTLWIQALRGKLGPQNALTVEITGLYWHFWTSCGSDLYRRVTDSMRQRE